MENFEIEKTKSTPSVYFNKSGILILTGNSYPEYPNIFYKQLSDKVIEFSRENKSLHITIEMLYVNTSSSKYLYDLIKIALDNINVVNITWAYEEDDEDMEELGKCFEESFNIEFEFKPMRSTYS